jgi:hypothetical protein
MLPHMARALLPSIPAVAVVLVVRAVEPFSRSLGVAVIEFVLYIAVTAAVTWMTERTLLREAIGYLRRARTGDVQPAI